MEAIQNVNYTCLSIGRDEHFLLTHFVLALRLAKKRTLVTIRDIFSEKTSTYLPDRQRELGVDLERLYSISFHQQLYHLLKHTNTKLCCINI